MGLFAEELSRRIRQVKESMEELEKCLRKVPEGRLRVSKGGKYTRYYLITPETEPNGRNIRNSQIKIAAALAQKEYEQKVLESLRKEWKLLKKIQQLYSTGTKQPKSLGTEYCGDWFYGPEEVIWPNLSEARKALVMPLVQTGEDFIAEWKSETYDPLPFYENDSDYMTDSGIRVRSKTEMIIAHKLDKRNIPYYYEKPLYLQGLGEIHPDFTVLNVRKRRTFYWEHMGMMDDPEYCAKALRKIEIYEKNGYLPGVDLIITHETSENPVRAGILDKMIEAYLL